MALSTAGVLLSGRQAAEDLMRDTGTIGRPGEPVFDPDTGLVTPSMTTVYAARKCNIRMPTATEVERLFGEEQVTVVRFIACFPHDTTGVKVDDVITVTSSEDADVETVTYKVVAVPRRTDVIYKAFGVEVIE